MSCTSPIRTYTNSKYFYSSVNRWKIQFSCGNCSSCNRRFRSEWRFRAYYELYDALKNGAFVLFDTLTYSDRFLRHYSDVCNAFGIPKIVDNVSFSRDDIKLFMKRLRRLLSYAGYPVEGDLRYIITSEYGTSDFTRGFKNSHRPHYHCLFICNFKIDPVLFSRFVSRAWQFGITDGVKPFDDCLKCPVKEYCKGICLYKSPLYVQSERLVRNGDTSQTLKAVNYVTKYISKDLYNYNRLRKFADDAFRLIMPDYDEDYLKYLQYRKFIRQVMPFHMESKSFGLAALKYLDKSRIEKCEKVCMPSSDIDVVKEIALPKYYRRKLWYTYDKIDGRVKWFLNEDGVNHSVDIIDRRISDFCNEFLSFKPNFDKNRLFDLGLYNCVYRNTLSSFKYFIKSFKDYYRELISVKYNPLYSNFGTFKDKMTVGKFIAAGEYFDDDGVIHYKHVFKHKDFQSSFLKVIDDKCNPLWSGFDVLLEQFYKWKSVNGSVSDIVETNKEIQLDRYKQLGLLK